MWQAAHSGSLFHSASHSRCGETFGYVKIDGAAGLPVECQFHERGEIEDAINAALRPLKLGCVIGGGTGLRYSYIDLALTDLRAGVNLVREVLQQNRLPLRTWVSFFDDDLGREWVGIHDETPAPP
jgi:hypothetical protein